MVSMAGRICRPPRRHDRREALIGFQGRGCAEVIQPNGCHSFLLEALLFQWLSTERCASRTMMELKTPESNKSVLFLPDPPAPPRKTARFLARSFPGGLGKKPADLAGV